MLRKDYTFTKRHLGILLVTGGLAALIGLLAIDLLNAGREGGIGPAQQIGLALAALAVSTGLTLIPLGDAPA